MASTGVTLRVSPTSLHTNKYILITICIFMFIFSCVYAADCSGNGTLIPDADDPTAPGSCICEPGFSGEICDVDECQYMTDALEDCNGRGSVVFDPLLGQCEKKCTCTDKKYVGITCKQPQVCASLSTSLSCVPYGYIPPVDNGKTCPPVCQCLFSFGGALCDKCNISCNKGEYNESAFCQDDLVDVPLCHCLGTALGKYCQFDQVELSIKIENRTIPTWLSTAITSKTANTETTALINDIINYFITTLEIPITNTITNNTDKDNTYIYNTETLKAIDVILSESIYDDCTVTLPVSFRVGHSLASIYDDAQSIYTKLQQNTSTGASKSPLNTIFDNHKLVVRTAATSTCARPVNDMTLTLLIPDIQQPVEAESDSSSYISSSSLSILFTTIALALCLLF